MKIISILSSFVLLFVVHGYGQNGQDGHISWNITNNILTLSGTGTMNDYNYSDRAAPWIIHKNVIKKIIIEDGITTIGQSAFALCSGLSEVELSGNIVTIGDNAFLGCSNLISIEIPNSTTTIGALTFGACRSITTINIPKSVTTIGEGVFSGCSSLTSIDVETDNIAFQSINGIVFSKNGETLYIYPGGKEETSYIIPEHVKELGYGAFLNCSNLTKIDIHEGIYTIGREAFYNCNNIETVKIAESVTSIGKNAFKYCNALKSIEVLWQIPSPIDNTIFPENITDIELIVPDDAKNIYEMTDGWKNFGTITEKSKVKNLNISKIKVHAFIANNNLTIDSPYAETIYMYNINGGLICSFKKNEDKITHPLPHLSSQVFIITSSKGWSRKIYYTHNICL